MSMTRKIEIGVFQDGLMMASAVGEDRGQVMAEAMRYAAVYSQDGPVEVREVKEGDLNDDPSANYAETVGGYDPDYWQ